MKTLDDLRAWLDSQGINPRQGWAEHRDGADYVLVVLIDADGEEYSQPLSWPAGAEFDETALLRELMRGRSWRLH